MVSDDVSEFYKSQDTLTLERFQKLLYEDYGEWRCEWVL